MPLLAWWPGEIEAGSVTDHVAYFGDFFATFAEIVETRKPEDLDSISFLPTLRGKAGDQRTHEHLYWEFHERGFTQAVLMDGRWKAIRLQHRGAPVNLYDVVNDIGERTDVAGEHPELVERAKRLFREAREESELWPIREPAAARR